MDCPQCNTAMVGFEGDEDYSAGIWCMECGYSTSTARRNYATFAKELSNLLDERRRCIQAQALWRDERGKLETRIGDAVVRKFSGKEIGDGRDLLAVAPNTRKRLAEGERAYQSACYREDVLDATIAHLRRTHNAYAYRFDEERTQLTLFGE